MGHFCLLYYWNKSHISTGGTYGIIPRREAVGYHKYILHGRECIYVHLLHNPSEEQRINTLNPKYYCNLKSINHPLMDWTTN